MLFTTHTLTGLIIGREIESPSLAFILAFLSHFVLDIIPHNDGPDDKVECDPNHKTSINQYLVVFIDFLFAAGFIYYYSSQHNFTSSIYWGIFGAILPDIIENFPFVQAKLRSLPFFKQFHQFHHWLQRKKTSILFGISLQYSISYCLILLLLH